MDMFTSYGHNRDFLMILAWLCHFKNWLRNRKISFSTVHVNATIIITRVVDYCAEVFFEDEPKKIGDMADHGYQHDNKYSITT